MEDAWKPLSASDFALATFGGTVNRFIGRGKRIYPNGVLGQSRWARNWGVSEDDLKAEVLRQIDANPDKRNTPEAEFLRRHFLQSRRGNRPVITVSMDNEGLTTIRINGEDFYYETEDPEIDVPKALLRGFYLSEIPQSLRLKPVESIENNIIHRNDDIVISRFENGSATAFVELMLRRKFWDGHYGLSPYVTAYRQALAGDQRISENEDDFEDDGDYVFVRYIVAIASDLVIQEAVAYVESCIRSVEERTDQLLARRIDSLTQLFDRGSFDADLDYTLRTSTSSTALVMVDIDHFKQVNDTFGHPVGDEVLHDVAQAVSSKCLASGAAYRYGGEELVVILTNANRDAALRLADSIRAGIEELEFQDTVLKVTVSLGVAVAPQDGKNRSDLVATADSALYAAKSSGRNCVRSAADKKLTHDSRH